MYEKAKSLFVVKTPKQAPVVVSRRAAQIASYRENIRKLKKAYKRVASDDEKSAIASLVSEYRDKLSNIRKAECSRKKRWRRKNLRSRFFKDPYGVARDVLSPKVFSQPTISQLDLDSHIGSICHDDMRDIPLGDLPGLPEPPVANTPFDDEPFHYQVLNMIVKNKRNASRPGVNGIPYKVYKNAPIFLTHFL